MDTEKTIEALNKLIVINNDRIEGYKTAAGEAKETDLKKLFSDLSQTSVECRKELVAEVTRLGGAPDEGTKTTGKFYRAWMDVKSALSGNDRATILDSCEFGEDVALQTYKKILTPTHKLIQLGVCGVLYPPNVLPQTCFDKTLIKQLSHGSDDVWLNSMCLINGTPIVTNKTFNKYFLTISGSQKVSLLAINSFQGRKDKILDAVHTYFKITESDFEKEVKK